MPKAETHFKFASVCSGIGAPECAWAPLGWRCEFTAEVERFPSEVLKHHYPKVPNYGDITKFKEWPGHKLDVLVGGTPCQSFSVAGLRKGLADPRGNLALTFLAIVDRYAPAWVLWENVPGVLSADEGRALGAFLGGLGKLGYGFAYRVLDAQYFGLAQRRKRVFVVGCIGGQWQRAAAVLFERESLCGNPAPRREAREGTAPTIAGCSNGGGANGPGRTVDDCESLVARSQRARANASHREDGTGRRVPLVMAHGQANSEVVSDGEPSLTCNHEAPIVFDTTQITSKGNFSNPKQGDPSHPLAVGQHPPALAFNFHSQNSCAMKGSGPAQAALETPIARALDGAGLTEQQGGTIALGPDYAVRRLTPRECERLQGFPDDYTLIEYRGKPAADGPRYKALGNSMAVPNIRWIGERISLVHSLLK